MKCQRIGPGHLAADCPQVANTCGMCAGEHHTETCQVSSIDDYRCTNCQTCVHAAWSRTCPAFLGGAIKFTARNPENLYKLFPTSAPNTWETLALPFDAQQPQNTQRPLQRERCYRVPAQRTSDKGWTHINRIRGTGPSADNGEKEKQSKFRSTPTELPNQRLTQSAIRDFIPRSRTIGAAVEAANCEEIVRNANSIRNDAMAELGRLRAECALSTPQPTQLHQEAHPSSSLAYTMNAVTTYNTGQ